MGISDLKEMCSRWDGSSEAFAEIVSATIKTLGVYQRDLAAEFEVAVSTVSRWASGTARPHPRFQKLIVTAIWKRASNALRSSGAAPAPLPRAAVGLKA
jgi:transcriptional regulator with XRE-family HTH domain